MSKPVSLEIFDVDSARLTELNIAMVMELTSAKITIKELISNRVQAEIIRHDNGEKFSALVQPDKTEQRLNNRTKGIDVDKQIAIALAAFNQNDFFLLVDDEQITDLEHEIHLTRDTHIAFYRLNPVVGG